MTDMDPLYQEMILELYRHPRNKGVIEDADREAEDANTSCGDIIRLTLRLGPDETIQDIAHDGYGCAISQAAVSLLTDYVKNKSKADVMRLTADDVVKLLGIPISHTRIKCATLGLNVLHNAIR